MTCSRRTASDRLERALRRLRIDARRRADATAPETLAAMSPPAFRSVVAHRLASLEQQVGELRGRINGLLFVVAGAVVTQVVLRLFA
jgi:hypothetical protein